MIDLLVILRTAKAQVVSSTVGGFMGEDRGNYQRTATAACTMCARGQIQCHLFIDNNTSIGAWMRTLSTLSRSYEVCKKHKMRLKNKKVGGVARKSP